MPDMPETMAVRERFFHDLAATIAGDAALTLEGWKQLVLVSQISDSTVDMTGFCYTGDGRAIAVSPSDFAIFEIIERLREAMAAADAGRPWPAALFRIDRETGKMTAEFEYSQPERWLVTPDNVKARAREFGPSG